MTVPDYNRVDTGKTIFEAHKRERSPCTYNVCSSFVPGAKTIFKWWKKKKKKNKFALIATESNCFNPALTNSWQFSTAEENGAGTLQKSKSPSTGNTWENKYLVRALYSYLSNGENQLSFLKGDFISVIGESPSILILLILILVLWSFLE